MPPAASCNTFLSVYLPVILFLTVGYLQVRPPVAPAASGEDFYRVVPFQILSWYPRIVLFPNFLDKARCEHVIKLAKARMKPSDLAYRPGETPKVVTTNYTPNMLLK